MANPSLSSLLQLLEMRQAINQHCTAIRATVDLLIQGRTEAAAARLDGAVAALQAMLRGQCAGFKMPCPECESEQGLEAWLDEHECGSCKAYLDPQDL